MQRALDGLPDFDRAIFVRVRLDDHGYHRVASDLGLSVIEVERGLARALLALDEAACCAEQRSWRARRKRAGAWLRDRLPPRWWR